MFLEKDEMKFAILYTLRQYPHPVSLTRLTELLTWDENVMSYFDLTIMLSELIEDGFTERLFYRNMECVKLTDRGIDADDYFADRVPASIRKKISDAVKREEFENLVNPNGVTTEIEPAGGGRYIAAVTMMDGGSPILEIKLDAGHRLQAARTAEALKNRAPEIYKYICKTLDEGS